MKSIIFILSFVFLSFSNEEQQAVCKQGDCTNGFGHTEFPNKDFYIGFTASGNIQGSGMYYFAETASTDESAMIGFNTSSKEGALLKAQYLRMNFSTNEMWLGKLTPGRYEDFTGIYFDKDQNPFKSYPSGNLPLDLSQDCLDGDCANSPSTLRFVDSKGLAHYYQGGFLAGKFEGPGIEFIPQDGKVLIGTFVNDACPDGTLYDLLTESAILYQAGAEVSHISFKFLVYTRPIDPNVIANMEAREKADKDAAAQKKERRKKMWGNIGLGVLAAGVVVAAVALSDDGSSSNNKSTANKSSATNKTSSSTSSKPSGSGSCYYCFWYNQEGISPIYEFKSSGVPSTDVMGSKFVNDQPQYIPTGNGYVVANPNYDESQTRTEKFRLGTRVCKTDFRIAQSARDAKWEQDDYDKELRVESVKGCN